ncbi:hypothetical protein, partial [Rhodococcus sp. WS3]|uniref:hypothetical protein n=1 Tax=Rhodococcus sp. WS3 TaxID=2486271 RepID=UPI001C9D832B
MAVYQCLADIICPADVSAVAVAACSEPNSRKALLLRLSTATDVLVREIPVGRVLTRHPEYSLRDDIAG